MFIDVPFRSPAAEQLLIPPEITGIRGQTVLIRIDAGGLRLVR
jgi:hypothetical protein